MKRIIFVFLFVAGAVTNSVADVWMPSVFGDHMVLQRDIRVPVWGAADPGEQVRVSINGRQAETRADDTGHWMVRLASMEAGGPFEMTVTGNNTLTFTDVLVGEVWICSGQSNMEMRVVHVNNTREEVAEAQYPNLRLFQITNDVDLTPQEDCEGAWERCRPSTVGLFSAVGYFFGRDIANELGVPVGMIHASWGGTTAECWMSPDARRNSSDYATIAARWDSVLAANGPEIIDYHRIMGEWEEDNHHAIYAGEPNIPYYAQPPQTRPRAGVTPSEPSLCYNGMIAPVAPYAIRGAIWYQGESNAGRAWQYRTLFPALIEDWRREWGQGDFPFLFVQLANYSRRRDEPGDSQWAELREAQTMTLDLPNTGMAVAIDIGNAIDIHPRNKQEVGRRLALSAMNVAYRADIVGSGPMYRSMRVENGAIRITFDGTADGLATPRGAALTGFAIAGADQKFVWADAVIDGNQVVVKSSAVPEPVAVRYGWAENPDCNLYNSAGLPASPFRTDDWPLTTMGRE